MPPPLFSWAVEHMATWSHKEEVDRHVLRGADGDESEPRVQSHMCKDGKKPDFMFTSYLAVVTTGTTSEKTSSDLGGALTQGLSLELRQALSMLPCMSPIDEIEAETEIESQLQRVKNVPVKETRGRDPR